MTGWFKVHREMKNSSIFADPQLLKLWMLCLMKASHSEHDQLIGKTVVKLQPGEFATGRFALADEYNNGCTKSQQIKELTVWRWLKTLEKMEMVNIKSSNKYSVVAIVNWVQYQSSEQQMNNRTSSNEQQMITNKNVKNYKNDKNKDDDVGSELIQDKKVKGPLSFTDEQFHSINFFNTNIRQSTPVVAEGIAEWVSDFSNQHEIINGAIKIAANNGATSWSYVEKILRDWKGRNVQTVEDARRAYEDFNGIGKNKEKTSYKKKTAAVDYAAIAEEEEVV